MAVPRFPLGPRLGAGCSSFGARLSSRGGLFDQPFSQLAGVLKVLRKLLLALPGLVLFVEQGDLVAGVVAELVRVVGAERLAVAEGESEGVGIRPQQGGVKGSSSP